MSVAAASRLIRAAAGDRGPRCLILPGAGAGVMPYLRLGASLGEAFGMEVDFIRAAGVVPDEPQEESVGQMADSVARVLAQTRVSPGLVLGWSLGGLVGWELCVRLAAHGHTPDLVILDSYPLPQVPVPEEAQRIRAELVRELGPKADQRAVNALVSTFDKQVAALADYQARDTYQGRVLLLLCSPPANAGPAVAAQRWLELAPRLSIGKLDAGHWQVFEPGHLPQLTAAVGAFLGLESKPQAGGSARRQRGPAGQLDLT